MNFIPTRVLVIALVGCILVSYGCDETPLAPV
jgi:hypothetical protein